VQVDVSHPSCLSDAVHGVNVALVVGHYGYGVSSVCWSTFIRIDAKEKTVRVLRHDNTALSASEVQHKNYDS